MVMDLQYFGGRGASSGIEHSITGADVTFDGKTTRFYFEKHGGTWYRQEGFGGTPEQMPNNMSPKEYIDRATKNGAKIQTISQKQKTVQEKEYKEDRKKTEKLLDNEDANVGGMRKWLRMDTRGRRGARRMI